MPGIAAVVLSGGLSRRFGGDKLLAPLLGKPLIAWVCAALRELTSDVYISVRDEGRWASLSACAPDMARPLFDIKEAGLAGPAAGIYAALTALPHDFILVVSGDMPWLEGRALRLLLNALRRKNADCASPWWPGGMVETLVQVHRKLADKEMLARWLRAKGEGARPSDLLRCRPITAYVPAYRLTSNPYCFANVNSPEDLLNPRPRGELKEARYVVVADGPKESYWSALEKKQRGITDEAAELFEQEAEAYLRLGLVHIASHALSDAISCLAPGSPRLAALAQRLALLRSSLPIYPRPPEKP